MRMMVGVVFLILLVAASEQNAAADGDPDPNQDLSVTQGYPLLVHGDISTRAKLARKLDIPVVDTLPLGEMLDYLGDTLGQKFDITELDQKFDFIEAEFKKAGVVEVLKKEVLFPRVKKALASRILHDILEQVDGDYYIKGDAIMIVPKQR
jgi:hypothetical protein